MLWFRYNYDGIKEVEVVKETAKQVVYIDEWWGKNKERRAAKGGNYPFFKTKKEAIAWGRNKLRNNIEYTKNNLLRAEAALREFDSEYT